MKLTRKQASRVAVLSKHPRKATNRALEALANDILLGPTPGNAPRGPEDEQEYPILSAKRQQAIRESEMLCGDASNVKRAAGMR